MLGWDSWPFQAPRQLKMAIQKCTATRHSVHHVLLAMRHRPAWRTRSPFSLTSRLVECVWHPDDTTESAESVSERSIQKTAEVGVKNDALSLLSCLPTDSFVHVVLPSPHLPCVVRVR
jgi:hypothetical protein